MPIAIMLLSWGWKAKNVAAGGGGMKVVIVCICQNVKNKANLIERENILEKETIN